jgi:hypothetical protein
LEVVEVIEASSSKGVFRPKMIQVLMNKLDSSPQATFKTMEIPLLKGRDITEQDVADAPHVMVINQALAKKFWPDNDALGKRISFSNNPPNWYQDCWRCRKRQASRALKRPKNQNCMFRSFNHCFLIGTCHQLYVAVRTVREPQSITGLIRNEVAGN